MGDDLDSELSEAEMALVVTLDVILNTLTALHPSVAPVLASLFEQHRLNFDALGREQASRVLGFLAATRANVADRLN